jgi:hypothetical protein
VTQTRLEFPNLVHPDTTDDLTLDERFAAFHNANPWVADRLEDMTDDLIRRGANKVGIKMLFEVMRWQS